MSSLGKVLITAKGVAGSGAALERLRSAGCEVVVRDTPTPVTEAWLMEQTRDVAGLIFAMEPVSARLIEGASKLQVIARPAVGFDTVDIDACTRRRIPVTLAVGTNHESVADFTFALLLSVARNVVAAVNATQQREWPRFPGTEVWGKTLTILGLGRVGKAVARRARGFDMRILAVTGTEDREFATRFGVEFVSLEEGLRAADFLSLHAPLSEATEGVINERALAMMKPGAYLINTARGSLVDEAALAEAVRTRRLAGAAVDVLRQEGPGSSSPLIGVPGILVTPHMATFAREASERVALAAVESVVQVLQGQRPAHVANPAIYED